MTPRNNPWQSYRKVATQTATPGHLVLMMYEGAISFLERSQVGFDYTDPLQRNQTINNNVLRAQAIIHEMNVRLDMKQGGDAAQTFRRLYNYFYRRLTEANLKKKKEPIEEIIMRLRVLRDSWKEMLQRGTSEPDPAQVAALASLQVA
jgi:flagellar protein FliS